MNIEKIREDFPLLQNRKSLIYFDNACVTLRPSQVIEAINSYYKEWSACAGRSLHKLGTAVTEKYQGARKAIAAFIGAKQKEIVFTRNTTEALNLVANCLDFKKGDVVLTTDKEHNSNLLPWQLLAKKGIKHIIVKSNPDNTFNLENFEDCMSKDVRLVSMVHTSNLDGCTIPAKDIIKIAHDHDALVMLDAAQSIPHKQVNVKKLDVDFLAFSGHKMLGPSGTGVLYSKYHLLEELKPFLVGGDTVKDSTYTSHELLPPPEKFEAGLQNYAGMLGLAEATLYLKKVGLENIEKHITGLNKYITKEMEDMKISIIGPAAELRSGIVPFNVKGIDPHQIALLLDQVGIAIRSGQHCVHSWFNAHNLEGSARASLYLYNTKAEAERFIKEFKKVVELTSK